GADVAGATVHLELPLDQDPLAGRVEPEPGEAPSPTTGAVIRSVPVASDGAFELTDIPSPAVYDVVVTKQGFSTNVQRLDVSAGESRLGVELPLVLGDGTISGQVLGAEGPLGRASVVAVSGSTRVETVSLTAELGDEGAFALRGLPTPGTYTVVVTAESYSAATLTFSLSAAQQLTGVDVVLGRDRGSLAGRVSVAGSGDGGGVNVTISDGAATVQTVTRSTSPVGAWEVAGLAVPGTYTLTFDRADLEQQVLSVSLDAFGEVIAGAPSASEVDATMRSATAVLEGTVTQTLGDGSPPERAGNVIVTLSSGSAEWRVTTASTPAGKRGSYRIEHLPPGTYTLSFARPGTRATSQIVVLSAGQELEQDAELVAPARVRGTVTQNGSALVGRLVLLYRAAAYGTAVGPVRQMVTNGDGEFDFLDVDAPDNYILEVRSASGATILGASSPFTLDASEDAEIDIEIVP
ncbi:MAG: carboxypeptidase-like regulatory domain-containing protein, partial [Actinomycetota bacterium]|nr:carboxypeptidase-like regulatory domain-containing protein [Actinomycetota bacterium]